MLSDVYGDTLLATTITSLPQTIICSASSQSSVDFAYCIAEPPDNVFSEELAKLEYSQAEEAQLITCFERKRKRARKIRLLKNNQRALVSFILKFPF